jgi:FixJ family two-component response regulator
MLANSETTRPESPLVVVTDDESAMRDALCDLLESVGLRVEQFSSASEMLASPRLKAANCLVLDVRLPTISGLELQQQLARAGVDVPVIFMTGHGDIPMSVKAMKAGAVDFLTKPFREQDMLDAILAAIDRDRARRGAAERGAHLQARFAQLTRREREVMTLVTDGLLNKQVADRLGLSEITVKVHRRQVMQKMGVRTLADLVRSASALGLNPSATAQAQTSQRALQSGRRPSGD